MKEAESEKEAAMEAELRAARERAVVPLEARMGQFRDMLLERGVHAPQHTTPLSSSLSLCLPSQFVSSLIYGPLDSQRYHVVA